MLRRAVPELADEIAREIIGMPRSPFSGQSRTRLRRTVELRLLRALERPARAGDEPGREGELYRALGRREFHAGRGLEHLHSTYQAAARLAWRRFSATALDGGWSPTATTALGERLLAHLEAITSWSSRGHEEARADTAAHDRHARTRLVHALLTPGSAPGSGEALAEHAAAARWRVPATIACLVVDGTGDRPLAAVLPPDVLVDAGRPDPCLVIPDPDAPGRRHWPHDLSAALAGTFFTIGPAVPPAEAPLSLRLAGQAMELARRGVLPARGYLRCTDHLATLLLTHDADLLDLMTGHLYKPLARLDPARRRRLAETLMIWLSTGGTAVDVGTRLHIHPQTARYRMRQLQEMFGAVLEDPVWRFEMQLILHTRLLMDRDGPA